MIKKLILKFLKSRFLYLKKVILIFLIIFLSLDPELSYQKKKFYPKSELLAYLIGSEINLNIQNIRDSKVIIIGSNYNSKLYSQAMQVLKINTTIIDSKKVTINGLKTLYKKFVDNEKQ